MKMALQTRHVLQNNLTKYFPEVPFQSWSSYEGENSVFVPSVSDEDEKSWECKKAPPGMFECQNFSLLYGTKFCTSNVDIMAEDQFKTCRHYFVLCFCVQSH